MRRLIFILVIAQALLYAPAVKAQSASPAATMLSIQALKPAPMGNNVQVVTQLTTEVGMPVRYEPIWLSGAGLIYMMELTDEDGYAYFNFPAQLGTGKYTLDIYYMGSTEFSASATTVELEVVPNTLQVQVLPPITGVEFDLNGRVFQSDGNGMAQIPVDYPGIYHLELLTTEKTDLKGRSKFKRWEEDIFTASRDVKVPGTLNLSVGFEQVYPVEIQFVDPAGQPVDPRRVSSVTLRGSHGAKNTYQLDEPIMLQRNRITRRLKGLDDVIIRYSVVDVEVDGSNAVNQGQHVFEVTPDEPWQVKLLIFSAHFNAREVFFGYQLGEGIELTYPDGHIEWIPFTADGNVVMDGLVRGLYYVRVYGAPGASVSVPLTISRNQNVELLVYGYPTIILAIVVPIITAIALLIAGYIRARAPRRYSSTAQKTKQEPESAKV